MQVRNRYNSTFRVHADKTSRPKLSRTKARKPRCRLKANGPKTKANRASNARLKKKFAAMGITECELRYQDCTRDGFLSWAHGKKRRKLHGDELDKLVCLACQNCHSQIEYLPPEQMLKVVLDAIERREVVA